jgi:hypothetical protein
MGDHVDAWPEAQAEALLPAVRRLGEAVSGDLAVRGAGATAASCQVLELRLRMWKVPAFTSRTTYFFEDFTFAPSSRLECQSMPHDFPVC